jgi:uncharacterized membrane-anchored protein YjiN (DUF445 family)
VLDDERVRGFFRSTVVARLEQVDVTRLAGQLLDVLTADQRHQQLLDGMLQQLAHMLDDETIKVAIAEVVATEVKYLRFVGLDNVAGRYATEKMVSASCDWPVRWAPIRSTRCAFASTNSSRRSSRA